MNSKNPGAAQVTSKGSPKPLGGSGSGRATPSTKVSLDQPQNGSSGANEVHSQQLSPNRSKPSPVADYAGDGKSYGAGGTKQLASNRFAPRHHTK